jgi:alkylation response protein AidB-like acyl-CoA dehydrogenase
MDFLFSAEEQTLRRDVRDFVRREWRSPYDSHGNSVYSHDVDVPEDDHLVQEFVRKIAAKGWYTMHWPKEHGGQAVPVSTQIAYQEEMAYQGAPLAVPGFEAPMLMIHGQQWQKDHFLPMIARGDIISWSQGFSEPNAGADLANLQTRAVQDGDDWVITGQKIWNSQAHHPWVKWGHYLVRTDPSAPKHRGISYFILDMSSPGIVIRPLYDALGRRRWSEVFLDGVRVPERNVIGELNRGWYAAMTTLSFERSGIGQPARRLRDLEQFIEFCRETRVNGAPLVHDVLVRHALAEARIDIEICRMICYRVASLQAKGEVPVREVAMTKLYQDEMVPRVFGNLAKLLREYGVLSVGEPRAPMGGYPAVNAYLSWMNRFAGGGREIQLNIIAQRALGLPR